MEMAVCNAGYIGNNNGTYEHRLVAEEMLGRKLLSSEIVHHRNGKRTDNTPENLFIFKNRSQHMKYHWYCWKYSHISKEEFIEKNEL